jgi:hypothetical protein
MTGRSSASHPHPPRRVTASAGNKPNREHSMKPVLALVTLALTVLIFEEKARQLAGDAQEAYNEVYAQAKKTLTEKVDRQPLLSLFVAGGVAYVLASIIPSRH